MVENVSSLALGFSQLLLNILQSNWRFHYLVFTWKPDGTLMVVEQLIEMRGKKTCGIETLLLMLSDISDLF